MKNYKEYPKINIGYSDRAELIIATAEEVSRLYFGEDGNYKAYIVDEDVKIPSHYYLRKEISAPWLKVYDDSSLTADFKGKGFRIYRAGEFGCIIQIIK